MAATLKDLDGRLFTEELKKETDSNKYNIVINIRCSDDLRIEKDLKTQLIIETQQELIKKVQVFLLNRFDSQYFDSKHLSEEETRGLVELILPWFRRGNYSYPLSVWLFSVRLLLRKPSLAPWQCSVLVHKDFREYDIVSVVLAVKAATKLHWAVSKSRGRRNYMEDLDFMYENVKISEKENIAVFGILDGHGGIDCAQFIAEEIPMKLTSLLRQGKSSLQALFQTFKDIDSDFLQTTVGSNAGSTACVLLFNYTQNLIFIANTGDTRAVLSRSNIALNLSYDRKATDPEEIARIVHRGGFVVNGRVMGSLAVSRAFGDSLLKKATSLTPIPSLAPLIVDPEITLLYPTKEDEFIVVATDGLWDVMTSQQVVDFVLRELSNEQIFLPPALSNDALKSKLSKISGKLVNHAIEDLKSQDNVTVMIVLLHSQQTRRPSLSNDPNPVSVRSSSTLENARSDTKAASNDDLDSFLQSLESNASNNDRVNGGSVRTSALDGSISNNSSHKSTSQSSIRAAKEKPLENDDDLMDFLKDDSNFFT